MQDSSVKPLTAHVWSHALLQLATAVTTAASQASAHLQNLAHALFRSLQLARRFTLRLQSEMMRQDLGRQVAVVLFIIVPGNLAVMAQQPWPPHLAVQPVPAAMQAAGQTQLAESLVISPYCYADMLLK